MLQTAVDFVWGMPLVVFLLSAGAYFLLLSRGRTFLYIGHAFRLLFKGNPHQKGEGQISAWQALSNELAATIGLGNISGVAVAIVQGGPGAVFWMWIAAAVGMNTKFFECTLSVMKRGKDFRGDTQGGPMYSLKSLNKSWATALAYLFTICGLVGTLSMFQINQVANFLTQQYEIPGIAAGITIGVLLAAILAGGLKRIAAVCGVLVPLMAVFFTLLCVYILAINAERLPDLFVGIFEHALTGSAIWGGFSGKAVSEIMKVGLKRATFSNEAGLGTSAMAHSNVQTSEPVTEGFVASLSPFFDTIIGCTLTALVILLAYDPSMAGQNGIQLSISAFQKSIPGWGIHLLGIAIFMFGFATMIGCANYNQKCWDFLFRGRWGLGRKTFIAWYCLTIVVGSVLALEDVINIIDLGYGIMAVPNIVLLVYFSKDITREINRYIDKYLVKKA